MRNHRCRCGVGRLQHGGCTSGSRSTSRRRKGSEGRTHRRQAQARQEGGHGRRGSKAKDHSRQKDDHASRARGTSSAGCSGTGRKRRRRNAVSPRVSTATRNRGHQRGDTTSGNHAAIFNGHCSECATRIAGTSRGVVASRKRHHQSSSCSPSTHDAWHTRATAGNAAVEWSAHRTCGWSHHSTAARRQSRSTAAGTSPTGS